MQQDNAKGTGSGYTTLFREYDPEICRWKSLDPKLKDFPSESPFSAMGNNPIMNTDVLGDYPVVRITKQKQGTTKLRILGYTASNKPQFTTVSLYKVTVTDTEDKAFKLSFTTTRDAFTVKSGDSKNDVMKLSNVPFEPKDGSKNWFTAVPMNGGYPKGNGTLALKLFQYGSESLHAEPNQTSVEMEYRQKSDIANGIMIHVGGFYKHADGSITGAASEGCYGIVPWDNSSSNPSNAYSNDNLQKIIDQSKQSVTNPGKILVIIEKRNEDEIVKSKNEKKL